MTIISEIACANITVEAVGSSYEICVEYFWSLLLHASSWILILNFGFSFPPHSLVTLSFSPYMHLLLSSFSPERYNSEERVIMMTDYHECSLIFLGSISFFLVLFSIKNARFFLGLLLVRKIMMFLSQ